MRWVHAHERDPAADVAYRSWASAGAKFAESIPFCDEFGSALDGAAEGRGGCGRREWYFWREKAGENLRGLRQTFLGKDDLDGQPAWR